MTIYTVADPLPRTHLSLHRYAKIMGINPLHFSGCDHSTLFSGDTCSKVWPRHTWQYSSQASWEDLAWAIKDAEQTLSSWLNYNVAPQWSVEEMHPFPKYRGKHFTNAINMQGQRAGLIIQKGRLIAGGQRGATLIHAGVAATYSDEDSDSFYETATITATIPAGTTISDWRKVRVYFAGTGADPRWEIRPISTVDVDAGAGTVTITANSYLFVDQDLRSAMPGAAFEAISLDDTSSLVETVDVYVEDNDTSQTASRLYWEKRPLLTCSSCSGVGCAECTFTTQNGCLVIRGELEGYVVPIPATYSNGAWASAEFTEKRSPDKVALWYYSGNIGDDYRDGLSNDPLEYWLAQAIAWMATARLDKKLCDCNNDNIERLQTDMAFVSPAGNFLAIADEIQRAPFGSRVGEWYAYQKVRYANRHYTVAVL